MNYLNSILKNLKTKSIILLTVSGLTIGFGGVIMALAVPLGVDASAPNCTVGGVSSPDYTTIQAAVDNTACTTITVASGVYAENVNIPRAVILNGPNAGIRGAGSRGAEATVNDINITASSVTVDGFSFVNPGIQMNITGTTTLSGVKVQNNIFSGYGSVGFPTYNAGNLLITGNLFKAPLANTEALQIKADASTLGGCNGTVVSNNVFTVASNNGGADINFSCTGSNSTGVTVSGNTDTGLADTNGTSFTAFSGVTGGIAVINNHVTGTSTSGSPVFFFGGVSGTATIDNNSMTNGGSSAIAILGGEYTSDGPNSGTFTITNNDLSGNHSGIYVSSVALASGGKVVAHQNNLSGETSYGIENLNSANIVADGTCNYWGAANGPGLVGPGSGSRVSTNVTFAPWLVTSNLNGSCAPHSISAPHITSPSNGAKLTSAQLTKVNWSNVRGMSPVTYQYQAFYDSGYTHLAYSSGWLTASEIPTPGTPIGNYYIQVRAMDGNGNLSPWSNDATNPYLITVVAEVGPPTTLAQCYNGGWMIFNTPSFNNKDRCTDYVIKHEHRISGDVTYTAYGLKREANFAMNTADNAGYFSYSDANHGWYEVTVSDVSVNGNDGYFAGIVTKASNHSWVGQWLFAKVQDGSPDQIWGSFTTKATAQNGVTSMSSSPADGPFVTKGHLEVN